jgi:hypothetical protein
MKEGVLHRGPLQESWRSDGRLRRPSVLTAVGTLTLMHDPGQGSDLDALRGSRADLSYPLRMTVARELSIV